MQAVSESNRKGEAATMARRRTPARQVANRGEGLTIGTSHSNVVVAAAGLYRANT